MGFRVELIDGTNAIVPVQVFQSHGQHSAKYSIEFIGRIAQLRQGGEFPFAQPLLTLAFSSQLFDEERDACTDNHAEEAPSRFREACPTNNDPDETTDDKSNDDPEDLSHPAELMADGCSKPGSGMLREAAVDFGFGLALGIFALPVSPETQSWGAIVSITAGVGKIMNGVGDLRGE